MALTYYFTPTAMSRERYDEVIRRLEAAGQGSPPGRQYHVCFGDESNLRVLDVWDSEESFSRFGDTLMPILQEVGVDPGQPDSAPVHNTIVGR
jgi:hypothetical protein